MTWQTNRYLTDEISKSKSKQIKLSCITVEYGELCLIFQ